jgi:hypothetical protein
MGRNIAANKKGMSVSDEAGDVAGIVAINGCHRRSGNERVPFTFRGSVPATKT